MTFSLGAQVVTEIAAHPLGAAQGGAQGGAPRGRGAGS